MTELELQQYLLHEYQQEDARCEWNVFDKPNADEFIRILRRENVSEAKEFKNLKNSFCGRYWWMCQWSR